MLTRIRDLSNVRHCRRADIEQVMKVSGQVLRDLIAHPSVEGQQALHTGPPD